MATRAASTASRAASSATRREAAPLARWRPVSAAVITPRPPAEAVSAKCQPNSRRSAAAKTAFTASPISPAHTAIAIMTVRSPSPFSSWAAKAPMPAIPVPMSSTATATTNANDAAIRTPVPMNGAALGSDTRRATDSGPKPKERSVSTASGSTLLTP